MCVFTCLSSLSLLRVIREVDLCMSPRIYVLSVVAAAGRFNKESWHLSFGVLHTYALCALEISSLIRRLGLGEIRQDFGLRCSSTTNKTPTLIRNRISELRRRGQALCLVCGEWWSIQKGVNGCMVSCVYVS